MDKKLQEAITAEADLLLKIQALPEANIFKFMQELKGGTYFNMGMYKVIKPAKAYKGSLRIYCVQNYSAIVSGVSYENIGTTKEFRDATGEVPGKSWYDHAPGLENKVGLKKSDPNAKYVLWDIKAGTTTWVRYYIVDIATGDVTAVSKDALLASTYLTQTEKNKLTPSVPTGFDKDAGTLVENKTVWRTAAFEHIFWLSQGGQNPMEFGAKFVEALELQEGTADTELFRDANAFAKADVDAILSGEILGEGCHEKKTTEELPPEPTKQEETEPLAESPTSEIFVDKHADIKTDVDEILSEGKEECTDDDCDEGCHNKKKKPVITEAYRRIVSRGASLVNNELFVDFD